MGFNQLDTATLNRAKDVFDVVVNDIPSVGRTQFKFPIGDARYPADVAVLLGDALMSATRMDQDVDVWIDVRSKTMPPLVEEAIGYCEGFGLRLVVTHGAKCSHGPNERLPLSLLTVIDKACATGPVWHPYLNELVPSLKGWVRHVQHLSEDHQVFTDPRTVAGYFQALSFVLQQAGNITLAKAMLVNIGGVGVALAVADRADVLVLAQFGLI